jgi:hypothetical protein
MELVYQEVLCPIYYLHDHPQGLTLMKDCTPTHHNKLWVQWRGTFDFKRVNAWLGVSEGPLKKTITFFHAS